MRRLSSAVFSASLLVSGAVGCSDDDDNKDPVGDGGRPLDGSVPLLDAGLDAAPGPNVDAGTPTVVVSSPAADLSVKINLLLSEHLILAAKATGAALGGAPRANEYKAYGALLNKNGTDLGDLVGAAYGEAAKTSFNGIWSAHNGFFVEYTLGVATSDQVKKDAAVNNLTTVYVPQFSTLIATATGLPKEAVTKLVTDHVLTTKAIVDAQGAKNWPATYTAIRAAFAHMKMLGDPLAKAVTVAKPTQFPGDVTAPAADFRVKLNLALQEHLYLASFATGAAIQGRTDEFMAANAALGANGTDIGSVVGSLYGATVEGSFNGIWSAHNGFFVDYTLGVATPDAAKKAAAVTSLTTIYVPQFSALLEAATGTSAATWSPGVAHHVETTAAVVDAQYLLQTASTEANGTAAAAADRAAGIHMQQLGDPLAKGIVAKKPASF